MKHEKKKKNIGKRIEKLLLCGAFFLAGIGIGTCVLGVYASVGSVPAGTSYYDELSQSDIDEVPVYTNEPEESVEGEVVETPAKDYRYNITDEEYQVFCRIVEAEVTGDDPMDVPSYGKNGKAMTEDELLIAKIRVAQVILNRVESPYFPNDIISVVYQKNAFSPIDDGRFDTVTVGSVATRAVDIALDLHSPDYTVCEDGRRAYFFQMYYCAPNPYGDVLFTDPSGHVFYSYNR